MDLRRTWTNAYFPDHAKRATQDSVFDWFGLLRRWTKLDWDRATARTVYEEPVRVRYGGNTGGQD
jgi:hypothetical protein